jgi:hypothetical protein
MRAVPNSVGSPAHARDDRRFASSAGSRGVNIADLLAWPPAAAVATHVGLCGDFRLDADATRAAPVVQSSQQTRTDC